MAGLGQFSPLGYFPVSLLDVHFLLPFDHFLLLLHRFCSSYGVYMGI